VPFTSLRAAYRRLGADLPFGDPALDHAAELEGYYWRVVAGDTVLVVLCGVGRAAGGRWALVALAAHPSGYVRHVIVARAAGFAGAFGVRAGDVLDGSATHLRLRLSAEDRVDLQLTPRLAWPRRAFGALGPAHLIPGLPQYWQPLLLDGVASGDAVVGGRPVRLDAAGVYAEKNWGPGFAGRWWWGQASAFPEAGVGVAFAGGALPRLGVSPTAVVVWREGEVYRFAPPLARSHVALGHERWQVRTRSPRYTVEIEGESAGSPAHALPVPERGEPGFQMRSRQLLAGRLTLRMTRAGRTLIDSVSQPAGLEQGVSAR
jgi:Tocopherol cyclase